MHVPHSFLDTPPGCGGGPVAPDECSPAPLLVPPSLYPLLPPPPPSSAASHGRSTFVTALIVAFSVVAFLALSLSAFFFVRRMRQQRRQREEALLEAAALAPPDAPPPGDDGPGEEVVHHAWHIRTVGLDEAAIESIALTRHHLGGGADSGDCTVCLGEFHDGELLRILPNCAHAFHAQCIDTWLRAHVTCPLCRATVMVPAIAADELPDPTPPAAGDDAEQIQDIVNPEHEQPVQHADEHQQQLAQIEQRDVDPQSTSPERTHGHPVLPRAQNFRRVASMDSPSPIVSAVEAGAEHEQGGGATKQLGTGASDHLNRAAMKRSLSAGSRWALLSWHRRTRTSLLPFCHCHPRSPETQIKPTAKSTTGLPHSNPSPRGGAMAAAAAVVFAATATASVAAAHPTVADVMSISVFLAVFFPVFIVLLAFACLNLFRRPPEDDGLPAPGSSAPASSSDWSRKGGGLDAAAIAALPLVFYREVRRHRLVDGREDALECSVCLLEFDDDDALRLLPTCPHAFHPECIGLWLERHATCPLCRASVLDAPPPPEQMELHPAPPPPLQSPESSPVHSTVLLIGEAAGAGEEGDEEEDWTTIQRLARNRRAAGRQALRRSNSTGHGGGSSDGGMERFALRLPEHVRMEILMSHRLRHVTSAVASVRVREGSAHDASTVGGSVRNAVARLVSLFAPGAGWKGDGDDRSGKADATGASSVRRRENSSRGAVAEEKRSV
nr:unnamed protein product [Digitaria exilis]